MGVRKGVEAIAERNKEVAKRSGQSMLPELILREDNEIAILRIMNDDPLDVDIHEIYDPAVGGRPLYPYCSAEDVGQCDFCDKEIPLKRMFFFWVYVYRIMHPTSDEEGLWIETKVGSKTFFEEQVNSIMLLKRKFGRGEYLWNQFEDVWENFGTWKDRDYAFKRKGAARDMDTTYSLTALDKSIMAKEIAELIGKLPSLEAVAKGTVIRLDMGETVPEKTVAKTSVEKPKVEIEIPDTDVEE